MKVSLHIQRVEPWMRQALIDWGVEGYKIVNPGGQDPFPEIKNKDIRFWTDDWDEAYVARGEQGGRDYVRRLEADIRARPWATTVQITCERDCNTNQGLWNLCAFMIGAMKELDARGLPKGVILNTAEGNPHDNGTGNEDVVRWKWQQLIPAIKYACDHGHFIGRHFYWRPGVEGPLGRYHALGRLLWDIEEWVKMGVDRAKLRVIVAECGLDGGIAGNTPREGWRNLSNIETYSAEVAILEGELRKHPEIARAYLFTAGFEPPWGGFNHDERDVRTIIQKVTAIPQEVDVIPIDGRLMNVEQFKNHIKGLDLKRVTKVVIHHTFKPNEATWKQHGGWSYWKGALKRHYESLGWTRAPHLFISYEGIGLFYDMTKEGRGVGGGYLEPGTLHIEMVGDYMTHLPTGATLSNTVEAAAAIMKQTGAVLTNHSEVVGGWECPGTMLKANWGWFRGLVQEKVSARLYLPHVTEEKVWDAATVLEKTRWWLEEEQRQREAGNAQRAQEIRLSLIAWVLSREIKLKEG